MTKIDVESRRYGDPLRSMGLDIEAFRGLQWWGIGLSAMAGLWAAEQKTPFRRKLAVAGVAAGGVAAALGKLLEIGAERNARSMMARRRR